MPNEYTIHMTRSAEADLVGIVNYIANEIMEPELASAKYDKIKREILALSEAPKRIPLVRDDELAMHGLRVMRVDNYHVFFIVGDERRQVQIVRIHYVRRDWMNLLRQDPLPHE